ncbi:TetR/AcrR family transcriptional regulator [Nonomuraea sp. MTCD27]|uniref:TetR/AcrR family transcriptional regulator n=1 Tax=Nonomuraea sp. MTCD27 TaxID=1676747 RepID=UPI0035C150AA
MLEAAQRHFLTYGVGTSLEAVAMEAGLGPGTLYRHFPTREALLAAVLQPRSEELVARQADIAQLGDECEALRQWLRAMEDYFSAFSGLPKPLMAAARAQVPDNPLTLPCDTLIATTDEYVRAAQFTGRVRASVTGYDLFLASVSSEEHVRHPRRRQPLELRTGGSLDPRHPKAVPRLDPSVQTPETVATINSSRCLVHQKRNQSQRRVTSSEKRPL